MDGGWEGRTGGGRGRWMEGQRREGGRDDEWEGGRDRGKEGGWMDGGRGRGGRDHNHKLLENTYHTTHQA